jgi:ABC-type nitrate/sulfonate/bicarbonate transport system substrate-binding protein
VKRFIQAALAAIVCCCAWPHALAATVAKPPPINVIMFAGVYNLPAWIAQRQGFFEKHRVAVNLSYTPNSVFLMSNLIDGKYDIAVTAIDNLIAYQEGQGEAAVTKAADLTAFMGLSSGFLQLVAVPEVKRITDLRGKSLALDALTTGYAFVLREMLTRAGIADAEVTFVAVGGGQQRYRSLIERKHAAGLLNTPFGEQAVEAGLNVLGTGGELLGSYQGHAAFAQREWIKANEATVIGFMRAYRDAMEWLFDARNRPVAEALLVANDAGMTPALARRVYDAAVDPKAGLYRNLAIDMQGMKTVLALRSKYARPAKTLGDPAKYVDSDLYTKAFGTPMPATPR